MLNNCFIFPLFAILPIISLSSNSFFLNWMTLELNLIVFLSFLIINIKSFFKPSLIYFIVQSFSSSLFIFSSILFLIFSNNFLKNLLLIIISISMLIKLNSFPFHSWMLKMIFYLNWTEFFILSTIQKLIPLSIMFHFKNKFLIYLAVMNLISGPLMMLGKSKIMEILVFSSLNHLGWMLILIFTSIHLWFLYWYIYTIILFVLYIFFFKLNIFNLKDLINMFPLKSKISILLLMLSLNGIPPFMGFLLKWMSIEILMIFNYSFFLMIIMMWSSLIIFFSYSKIMYLSILTKSILIKLIYQINMTNFSLSMIMFISTVNLFMLFNII
uniref:NADH-ubiquinone oxidoreductase chain 2 n=1 Tax=Parevania sp. ZJUH_2016024 TaxID=2491165 RepID=A0A3Q8UA77_9HYME|nr:NADH dehydrogenase subunit 2 [Parevania sp. ZJUH_2016024]